MRSYLLGVLTGVLMTGLAVWGYKAEKDLRAGAMQPASTDSPTPGRSAAATPPRRNVNRKALKILKLNGKWESGFGGNRHLKLAGKVQSLLKRDVVSKAHCLFALSLPLGDTGKVLKRSGQIIFMGMRIDMLSGPLGAGKIGKLKGGGIGTAIYFKKAELMYPPRPIRLRLTLVSSTPTGRRFSQSWDFTIPHPKKKRRFALAL